MSRASALLINKYKIMVTELIIDIYTSLFCIVNQLT